MAHTLLLVDDEEKVLEFMEPFLRQEGFHILTAKTGREALRKAKEHKPTLVVLDWMLPEMSGIEVCRELRKISRVGIIMVTAKTEETDKIIGLEVGADELRTPLTIIRGKLDLFQQHGQPIEPQHLLPLQDDLIPPKN